MKYRALFGVFRARVPEAQRRDDLFGGVVKGSLTVLLDGLESVGAVQQASIICLGWRPLSRQGPGCDHKPIDLAASHPE